MSNFPYFILQPKFGGKVIDIVSGHIETPEEKAEALHEVKSTILHIFVIVVIGYELCICSFYPFDLSFGNYLHNQSFPFCQSTRMHQSRDCFGCR